MSYVTSSIVFNCTHKHSEPNKDLVFLATHIVQVRKVDLDRCRQEARVGLHRYRDDLRVEQRAVAKREGDDRSIRITRIDQVH